jgi:phosphoribosylanthranilate isomerase
MPPSRENEFIVKICGITNEADAQIAVEAGVNAIGLNFYGRSPRFISAGRAREIARLIPASILKVGVFVNDNADNITAIAKQVQLDIIQLHGTIHGDLSGFRIWRAVPVDEQFPNSLHDSRNDEIAVEAYLLDTPTTHFGGSGHAFEWSRAAGLSQRIVLAGGLDASNVGQAISIAHPWGVDACSRLELSPGKKDAQKMRDFVAEALRAGLGGARRAEPLKQELLS